MRNVAPTSTVTTTAHVSPALSAVRYCSRFFRALVQPRSPRLSFASVHAAVFISVPSRHLVGLAIVRVRRQCVISSRSRNEFTKTNPGWPSFAWCPNDRTCAPRVFGFGCVGVGCVCHPGASRYVTHLGSQIPVVAHWPTDNNERLASYDTLYCAMYHRCGSQSSESQILRVWFELLKLSTTNLVAWLEAWRQRRRLHFERVRPRYQRFTRPPVS